MNRSLVVAVVVAVVVCVMYAEIRLASAPPPATPAAVDGQRVRQLEARVAYRSGLAVFPDSENIRKALEAMD